MKKTETNIPKASVLRVVIVLFAVVIALLAVVITASAAGSKRAIVTPPQRQPYTESIAGTTVTFDMVPVGGGIVGFPDPATPEGSRLIEVSPFWIGKTEVTWDEFDVWMLGLDVEPAQRGRIDAESRPSRPYGAPDRGFGHARYAAISVTFQAAERYAEWLSEKTGRRYRLPAWAEWQLACVGNLAGDGVHDATPNAGAIPNAGALPTSAAIPGTVMAMALETQVWHAGNADGATHPVASLQPGDLGLYDMLGNAAEWASGPDGEPALHGGSYRDQPHDVQCFTRAEQDDSWNERDPQIPKSSWWLSDGPFAGFRIVREADDQARAGARVPSPKSLRSTSRNDSLFRKR